MASSSGIEEDSRTIDLDCNQDSSASAAAAEAVESSEIADDEQNTFLVGYCRSSSGNVSFGVNAFSQGGCSNKKTNYVETFQGPHKWRRHLRHVPSTKRKKSPPTHSQQVPSEAPDTHKKDFDMSDSVRTFM